MSVPQSYSHFLGRRDLLAAKALELQRDPEMVLMALRQEGVAASPWINEDITKGQWIPRTITSSR